MAFASKTADPARTREMSIGCLTFFALIFTCFVLVLDGFIGWGMYRQIQAGGFVTAPGRVTQSSIESHRGSKGGMTYSPKIAYTYRIGGKNYRGTHYRFMDWSGNYESARRAVGAFPVGKAIDVFYSPDDPAIAILKPGIEGGDLLIAMFLTPFNLVMLAMWWMIGANAYRRAFPVPAGGAKIIDDGFTTRVRLSRTSPLLVGVAALAILDFVGMLVTVVTMGTDPPPRNLCAVWAAAVVVALIVAALAWIRNSRADNDLVIDEPGRHVTLPLTFGRTEALTVPLAQARAIDVEQIVMKGAKGSTYFRYAPTLIFSAHDGSERREKLAEWSSRTDSDQLAAWLRERLRLAPAAQESDGGST